jgi:acyl-CoA synthetase (AMP-forming)/AMP-acid ligase II
MISHRNVIANILQIKTFEKPSRDKKKVPGSLLGFTDVVLGLLPQSHIYSLIVICHAATYRGDQVVNLPKFEANQFLGAIQRFKIHVLYLVHSTLRIFLPKGL